MNNPAVKMVQDNPIKAGDRLFLIDGSGFIFRAYHALPALSRQSDGLPVGAVSGFCNMLFKLREELKSETQPTHIAVIFDAGSVTFRNEIYTEYKAHRPPPPEDLIPQFSLCREATQAFGLKSIEMAGYEADDLIATYAKYASQMGAEVRIYSSDKDLMQLVDQNIYMIDPMKNKVIQREQVFEKFGVYPESVIDVQALTGDSTDNIPGVPGIGVKTAAQLIHEYGDLENLLKNAEQIKQKKRRENILEYAELAKVSRELVTLKQDVPVEVSLVEMELRDISPDDVLPFLEKMEFNTLTKRVRAKLGQSGHNIEASAHIAAPLQQDLFGGASVNPVLEAKDNIYQSITDIEALEAYIKEIEKTGYVAFDTETTGLEIASAELVGIALSHKAGEAVYIPLQHKTEDKQIPLEDALQLLRPVLSAPHILKIGQNLKYDLSIMARYDVDITPIDDTMLLSFAMRGGKHRHNMDELSQIYLDHTPISYESVCGKGKQKITFDYVLLDQATSYAAEDADITLRLWHIFSHDVIAQKRKNFYEMIERKMPHIVASMERNGIAVDSRSLEEISERFGLESEDIAQKIYDISGKEFNIASPKQLGEVLYDHMGLEVPGKKKTTATGQAATGVDVLEGLAAEGHEIADYILKWRGLQKLKSTYADSLVDHINPKTGRVHTSFNLTGAATGRFSSSDPNLQNIPIKTEEGRLIRQAFIPKEGYKILSADYSQIELRLLAHIADVPMLKEAFAKGEDIHARTASEVFGVPIDAIDSSLRRKAKAVNFGIIYGISAFGLARQLKIPQSEAKHYIDTYFERLPQIKHYMDVTKERAKQQGYVETLYGRPIYIKDIQTRNYMQRSFAERAAINAPIQGTAADVIKLAMIDVYKYLMRHSNIKMLLQIHDELLFEVPEGEIALFSEKVKTIMEAAPLKRHNLTVKPIVEVGCGKNWDEAH
ncbi:MAG: DNA polymerase I [Pseudomonadota bacterium]